MQLSWQNTCRQQQRQTDQQCLCKQPPTIYTPSFYHLLTYSSTLAQRQTCSPRHAYPAKVATVHVRLAITGLMHAGSTRAHQEVIWFHICMQCVGAVHALHACNDLCQDELGNVQAEDQPLPVAAFEPACCLPAFTCPTNMAWLLGDKISL